MYTNRVDKSCNSLEHEPLGEDFQGVLVSSLDAVEHLLLVTVHGGILRRETQVLTTDHPEVAQTSVVAQRYLDVVLLPRGANFSGEVAQHYPAVQIRQNHVSEFGRQRVQDGHFC